MKILLCLLFTVCSLEAEEYSFEWTHEDTNLVAFYVFHRAAPEEGYARVDSTEKREITVEIPPTSIVYVTAVDTMGRESLPSPKLDLTQLPPPPKDMRAVVRFEWSYP